MPMKDGTDREPIPYLTTTAREAQAEFSLDGRFVAYTSVSSGEPEIYVQPFPNAADGKWLISSGGGVEPHWSRDGKELFYFAGQTLMAVPVSLKPTFSHGVPVRLFDAPVQPWFTNDTDRSQVAPDGRFLLLVPASQTTPPPIDVIVNWPALVEK
jgi:Tol biopolymer transport system component